MIYQKSLGIRLLTAITLAVLASAGCAESPGGEAETCRDGAVCLVPRLAVDQTLVTISNAAGASRTRHLTLVSTGDAPVHLEALEIIGEGTAAEAFSVRLGRDEVGAQRVEADVELAPGEERIIEVAYDGNAFGADDAVLEIVSDAPDSPTIVRLTTANATLRLQITPNPLDFGNVPFGTEARATLTVSNTGEQVAHLTEVERVGSPDFRIVAADVPRDLAPGESMPIEVAYLPPTRSPDFGGVRVAFGTAAGNVFGQLEAELSGSGTPAPEDCPAAVALGEQTHDAEGNAIVDPLGMRAALEVEPGAWVRLSGLASSDPDGDTITSWQWRVAQVPPDFVLDFSNDTSPQMDLQLRQVGTYAFELDVADDHGESSCQSGRVEIVVAP